MTELHYLSERLAGDLIYAQEDAASRGLIEEREADFEPVIERPLGAVDRSNPFSIATHAEAIAREAGASENLEDPAQYLLLRSAPVRLWVLHLKEGGTAPFAFATVRERQGIAVLLGSAKNVRGWETVAEMDGWVPSHAAAMSRIVRSLARPEGEAGLSGMDFSQTAEDAAYIAASLTQTPDMRGFCDVLARLYHHEKDITFPVLTSGPGQALEFRVVSVGAPIFIRESARLG